MGTSKTPKQSENLISDVLHIVHDKILELLPIRDAARTSVLSKQWRFNWLSLKHLDFDEDFFHEMKSDWQDCSSIISSILLHRSQGPIHKFSFFIPQEANIVHCEYLPQWIYVLSKTEVKCVKIWNEVHIRPILSYIYWCSELTHLELDNLTVHPPPSGFSGFLKLQHLALTLTQFPQEDILPGLVAKCRKLVSLKLESCYDMVHIFIDLPSLETLTIVSESERDLIAFGNVCNLKSITIIVYTGKLPTVVTINSFNKLASLRQLQCIKIHGDFLKVLAVASIKRPIPITFNHLNKLTLSSVDLSAHGVLRNIFDMVESCPYMKELIFDVHSEKNVNHQKLDCTKFHKSPHLVKVKISGITGSGVEIQLIEYLFTIAVALDTLFYESYARDTESQLKLSRILSEIPRASPKACLVRLR